MIKLIAVAFIAASALAPAVHADGTHGKKGHAAAQSSVDMADGEVRKVDKDAKKITIRHGPLAKLDMPAMTMVFQVKDPAMLDQVKAGDRVRFDAEKIGGGYVVTRIEAAK